IASTTRLNTPGQSLSRLEPVHALPDVTGFGLLGHLLEVCHGARRSARGSAAAVARIAGVDDVVARGFAAGASQRNWAGYGHEVRRSPRVGDGLRTLLTGPQTSGGLLVSCAPHAVDEVLEVFRRDGFDAACEIGELVAGEPGVEVLD